MIPLPLHPIIPVVIKIILATTATNVSASEPEPGNWACKTSFFSDKEILTIEGLTVKMPPNIEIEAEFYLDGLTRRWVFGPEHKHHVIIAIDGSGGYYDFTGVKRGKRVAPETRLSCDPK